MAETSGERHASWGELFFDLVAVAGVAMLGHLLAGEFNLTSLGLFGILFIAFWLTWTTYMLYGNSTDNPRLARLLIGMFGLGVMAASVPGLAESILHPHEDPSTTYAAAFALAYVLTRWVGASSWSRGQILTEFPISQSILGALPWLVSLWVPLEWRPWLWLVGLGIDLIQLIIVDGNRRLDQLEERYQEGLERLQAEQAAGRGRVHRDRHGKVHTRAERFAAIQIAPVQLSPEHLDERLGLFVIIVLGEGVIQLVGGASSIEWGQGMWFSAVISFALLASIFITALIQGHAGIAFLTSGSPGIRFTLAAHAISTASLIGIAISLESMITHPHAALEAQQRWLLCGGLATYFAIGLIARLRAQGWRAGPVALTGITGVLVPILLGGWAPERSAELVVGYATAVVVAQLWLARGKRVPRRRRNKS